MAENNKLIELTNQGLKISSKEQIKDHLKGIISEAYGTDINFNPSYPDGIFVEALASPIRDTFEAIEGLYNSFNIRNSSGVMLDSLSNLINIHRKKRTQSSGILQITLEEGRTYSWNYISVKDQNNNIWRNIDTFNKAVTSSPETIEIQMTCDRFGVVEEPTSFTVMNPLTTEGMNLANSLTSIIQGDFDEDDISLRNRVANTPVYNTSKIKEQLIKLLLENKYVKSVKLYNNDLDSAIPMKLKGTGGSQVLLPATQLGIIIQYNENLFPTSDNKDEISKIISDYKGLSTITFNPEGFIPEGHIREYKYTDPQNMDIYHYVYYIEAQKKTGVVINIDISGGVNFNNVATVPFVKELVGEYLRGLGVGVNLIVGGLMSYLYENADKQFVVNGITIPNQKNINNDEYFSDKIEDGFLEVNVTVQSGG